MLSSTTQTHFGSLMMTASFVIILCCGLGSCQKTTKENLFEEDVMEKLTQLSNQLNVISNDQCQYKKRDCDRGWKIFNNSCYFVPGEKKTWHAASQYCLFDVNAHLAVLESYEEMEAIIKILFPSIDNLWVGARKRNDQFYWNICTADNGFSCEDEVVKPELWAPGEPYGDGEYVHIQSHTNGLNDIPDTQFSFLCEYSLL